jgi:hypothetical protein
MGTIAVGGAADARSSSTPIRSPTSPRSLRTSRVGLACGEGGAAGGGEVEPGARPLADVALADFDVVVV